MEIAPFQGSFDNNGFILRAVKEQGKTFKTGKYINSRIVNKRDSFKLCCNFLKRTTIFKIILVEISKKN